MKTDRDTLADWSGRVDPEPDSLRWHQCIQPLASTHADAAPAGSVVLLGFACDEGVRRNQGRTGAAAGPRAIRKALSALAWHRSAPAHDAGDVVAGDGDLEGAQVRLALSITALLAAGHFPIVLGGGHEVAFGSWSGLAGHVSAHPIANRPPRIGIINLDAHFDLRDPRHVHSSGTPFAQIAEQCQARAWPFLYACLGVSRASNTQALYRRARSLGTLVREDDQITPLTLAAVVQELDAFMAGCDALYLSIDLDVLPACEVPAVSAPAARGVALALLEPLIARVRDSGKLSLADIAELNPDHDIDGRSARVAARLVHLLTTSSLQEART